MFRVFVKIVCTIGPASEKYETLRAMAEAGMNVARFNFSHGDYEQHGRNLGLVRSLERDRGIPIAALLDTKGPEIRTGEVENGAVELKAGSHVLLTPEECLGTPERVHVKYPKFAEEIKPGQSVYIDDGEIYMEAEESGPGGVMCRVIAGGRLENTKGINVPGAALSMPALSDRDVQDIKWGAERGMEFLAMSFVKTGGDVERARGLLNALGSEMRIAAKIETREAVANIEDVVDASDGVMVARGDLGVEIPTEDVPLVQKHIIALCRARGKFVIVATQMLDSMIRSPRPTRAEATDVANAVLDGADAVMLSGESASGLYPVQAVATMRRIADRAERELGRWGLPCRENMEIAGVPDAVSDAAVLISKEMGAAAIVSITQSGFTARMVSKHRPSCPILGVTSSERTWRDMAMLWGVTPVMSDRSGLSPRDAVSICKAAGLLKDGDTAVVTAGFPVGTVGSTNTIEVVMA